MTLTDHEVTRQLGVYRKFRRRKSIFSALYSIGGGGFCAQLIIFNVTEPNPFTIGWAILSGLMFLAGLTGTFLTNRAVKKELSP